MKTNIVKTVKSVVRFLRRIPLLKELIEGIVLQIHIRNYDNSNRIGWTNRRTSPTDKHLDIYWDSESDHNRLNLVKLICDLLQERHSHGGLSILEFGSHVGINLKMINEAMLEKNIEVIYYAVEPNVEAFQFMTDKVRFVNALNCNDMDFVRYKNFPDQYISVGLVNAVFYSMGYRSAYRVLRKMSRVCDVLVIGDEMGNFNGNRSQFFNGKDHEGNEYFSFAHPFRKMFLGSSPKRVGEL